MVRRNHFRRFPVFVYCICKNGGRGEGVRLPACPGREVSHMAEKVNVLVVDDQYVSRSFFELQVQMSQNYALVASLAGAEKAAAYCAAHPVDLVIMDVMMKYGADGLTCAKRIKHQNPKIRIILTTSAAEAGWIEEARKAGIDSFWYKEYSSVSLTEVMDRTMAGVSVYPDDPPNPAFGEISKADLTERELDILRELTRNLTNEEIAKALHISEFTVKRHIQNILEKTGYKNRIDLAVNAKTLGLVVHEKDRIKNGGGHRA